MYSPSGCSRAVWVSLYFNIRDDILKNAGLSLAHAGWVLDGTCRWVKNHAMLGFCYPHMGCNKPAVELKNFGPVVCSVQYLPSMRCKQPSIFVFYIVDKILWKSMGTVNCVVTVIYHNIISCSTETHTGLKQHEGGTYFSFLGELSL